MPAHADGGFLYLHWSTASGDGFSFTLEIAAVDTAGNLSAAKSIVVGESGEGGCSVGRHTSGPIGPLGWVITTAFAARFFRRRTPRGVDSNVGRRHRKA
jgi:hypothetical protein